MPVTLHPFSEAVGIVSRVGENTISLTSSVQFKVPASELARWKEKLKPGYLVGILVLDDGCLRVRRIGAAIRRPVAV